MGDSELIEYLTGGFYLRAWEYTEIDERLWVRDQDYNSALLR